MGFNLAIADQMEERFAILVLESGLSVRGAVEAVCQENAAAQSRYLLFALASFAINLEDPPLGRSQKSLEDTNEAFRECAILSLELAAASDESMPLKALADFWARTSFLGA